MTVPSMRVWDFRTVHVFWFWCRSINDAKHDQLRRTFATAIDSSKISTLREVEASKGKKVGNWGSFVHNKVDPQSTCQPCMMFLMTTLNDSSSWGNGKQVKIIYFPAHALSIFIDFSTYYQPAFDLATSASSLHWLTPDMPPCILTQMKNGRNYLTFSWQPMPCGSARKLQWVKTFLVTLQGYQGHPRSPDSKPLVKLPMLRQAMSYFFNNFDSSWAIRWLQVWRWSSAVLSIYTEPCTQKYGDGFCASSTLVAFDAFEGAFVCV